MAPGVSIMVLLRSDPLITAVYILGAASQFATWQDPPAVIVSPSGDEFNPFPPRIAVDRCQGRFALIRFGPCPQAPLRNAFREALHRDTTNRGLGVRLPFLLGGNLTPFRQLADQNAKNMRFSRRF